MTCEGCGLPLDDYEGQVYQMVTGWAKSEGGQTTGLVLGKRDEQRFACARCANDFIGEVVWPKQLTLFDQSSQPD